MGFDINGLRLLVNAKKLGVNFEKTITIGRQGLYLESSEIKKIIEEAKLVNDGDEISFKRFDFAESFLNLLGAKVTDSIDASNHEGATYIYDLNLPLPNNFDSKYSLVIDGGTLEHIFNFPIAIENCMKLVAKDGFYIGITPANNWFGHGFYQFSPELYYRIFSPDNGFKIIKMYFFIDRKKSPIYEIRDPLELKHRVTMVNSFPSYLFVIAQKVEEKELFKKTPQQSDYEHVVWKGEDYKIHEETKKEIKFKLIKKIIPKFLKFKLYKLKRKMIKRKNKVTKLYNLYTKPTGISNSAFINKIDESEINN
ncbi:hypothetical protein ACFO5O_02585 [Geojedonia litorea]|uniref:Methyltransferase domain-containing protein n=1 Tax=Geojedonia litorea TaxID=1268269 RepID=A0ABV9N2J7_9FLAO